VGSQENEYGRRMPVEFPNEQVEFPNELQDAAETQLAVIPD